MKINGYVKNCMTKKEREQHKDLIDECLEREKELDNMDIEGDFKKVIDTFKDMVYKLEDMSIQLDRINETLEKKKLEVIPNINNYEH